MASSTSAPASQDELLLVERVFLRIGSASTDPALEAELHKFLPPIILKLSSPAEAVRKKVMELLIHVNRRLKDLEHIQLPVETLLTQYQDPSATSFVTNFSIIYIKMGYPRLDVNKQVELIPSVLNCLEGKPVQHQDSLLLLLMPVLQHLKLETHEKMASLSILQAKPTIARLLMDFLLDLLLLPYGVTPLSQQGPPETNDEPQNNHLVPGVPAGMSISSFKRVCEHPWKSEELEKVKISIVKFLSTEILPLDSIALALIVASADTRFAVANAAEMSLRRLDSSLDWNNVSVVASIYVLFLGTLTPKERTAPDKFKNPANTRIRLKLMPFLLKSKEATNYAPLALKVFYECVWGQASNSKLKKQGIMFLHHVAFVADKEKLIPVGEPLFQGVVKVIEEELKDPKLRSLAYGALGKLSLKLPSLLLSHPSQLHYIQTLMNALLKEEGDILLSVQEALSMIAPVCRDLTVKSQEQLCVLLSEHVMHPNPQLRRTAVHYAASVFSQDHVASRFILMIATGDTQDDLRIEARRQLYNPVREDKDGTPHFRVPPFSDMIAFVIERMNSMPKSKWFDVANHLVPFSLPVMEQILIYLEHCLSVEATNNKSSEEQLYWDDCPAIGAALSKIVEQHKREKHQNPEKECYNPVDQYLGFAELAVNAWSARALKSILRFVAVTPNDLVPQYAPRIDWIKKYMMRGGVYGEVAAHLFGVVVGHFTNVESFEKALQPIMKIKDKRLESQESCILGQGFSFSYKLHALKKTDSLPSNWDCHQSTALALAKLLDGGNLLHPTLISIGELSRNAPFPLPFEASEGTPSMKSLFAELKKIYTNKKLSSKIREEAIRVSGYLCVGNPDNPLKFDMIEGLLALAKESNELEIHFAVGEALADCILGSESPSARNIWLEEDQLAKNEDQSEEMSGLEEKEKDSEEMMEKAEARAKDSEENEPMEVDAAKPKSSDDFAKGSLEWLLQELLDNYVTKSQPSCRQASCLWLLAVLKKCRHKPSIQGFLAQIQSAFMNLLGDDNDLIQDAASKGLGVVYKCCNETTRGSMVEALVQTLTVGKRSQTKIEKDTKIFKQGELGKAPSGGQLSTYRELCSLASDLNQPELIYKFMNLASHNAVWSSKKGAAFGFSTLASQAGAQLEPYLPQIIPKLYRYQHDPTPKIQQPMASIWNSLVTDNAKTIEKFYDPILEDILSFLTHDTWRVRESCCNALADLLRRQPVTRAIGRMSELWTILFRVRDDIKESVRLAAERTLQALSKSCIKVCDTPGQESEKMLREVLPILLTSGITSSVSEVRNVSLQTLMKICRSGGSMVKPHLGNLIPALLEALSGLEHQALSYTSVRVDEDNRDKLDTARVMAAKSTPMMDTLNYVLQFVDEDVLELVISGVIDVLKRSIGLTSRTGAAHVVETLTYTCPLSLEKYTGKILAALVTGMGDRNPVIRKVFAHAIGKLVKTAKSSSIDKLLTKLQSWYLEKEEDSAKLSAALVIHSMHVQNCDTMKDHGSQAMPLAFLAQHVEKNPDGTDPTGGEIWEEIWSENTPGTEAGVRLYLLEIINVCDIALQSSNWSTKAQAGRALGTLSKKLGSSLTGPQLIKVSKLLLGSLQGRTWKGKEALVAALSSLFLNVKDTLKELKDPDSESTILDLALNALMKEAKKEKMEYKLYALKALTEVLDAYQVDRFEDVFQICLPYLALEKEKQEGEQTSEQRSSKEESLKWDLIDEMVHSLGRAWPTTLQTQEKYSEQVIEMLSHSITRVPRRTQLSIIRAVRSFWGGHFMLQELPTSIDHVLFGTLIHFTCKIFNFSLSVAKYYSLRRESLVVLNEFLERAQKSAVFISRLRTEVLSSVEEAKRDSQPDIQALASTACKLLQAGQ